MIYARFTLFVPIADAHDLHALINEKGWASHEQMPFERTDGAFVEAYAIAPKPEPEPSLPESD